MKWWILSTNFFSTNFIIFSLVWDQKKKKKKKKKKNKYKKINKIIKKKKKKKKTNPSKKREEEEEEEKEKEEEETQGGNGRRGRGGEQSADGRVSRELERYGTWGGFFCVRSLTFVVVFFHVFWILFSLSPVFWFQIVSALARRDHRWRRTTTLSFYYFSSYQGVYEFANEFDIDFIAGGQNDDGEGRANESLLRKGFSPSLRGGGGGTANANATNGTPRCCVFARVAFF